MQNKEKQKKRKGKNAPLERPQSLKEVTVKHIWHYLWKETSWHSFIVFFIFSIVIIKFLIFPTIGLITGAENPLVAIITGSMEHKISNHKICGFYVADSENKRLSLQGYWELCGTYYEENFNITYEQFKGFTYSNGLNIGDILLLTGADPERIRVGDTLVFIPQDKIDGQSQFFSRFGPVIHRVIAITDCRNTVSKECAGRSGLYFHTKGDHNAISRVGFETYIPEEDLLGVPLLRIPYVGYPKILLAKAYFALRG